MDEEGELWFDFHLETDEYYAEDETDDIEEPESDWKAKIVWGNYHSCTISSTEWHFGGIPLDRTKGATNFDDLLKLGLFADPLPLKEDFDYEDLAFHIYLLGHDSCANHRLQFTKTSNSTFNIEWNGKIALTYAGATEFAYDFTAFLQDIPFEGFAIPNTLPIEKAKKMFEEKWANFGSFECVNPEKPEEAYKLKLK